MGLFSDKNVYPTREEVKQIAKEIVEGFRQGWRELQAGGQNPDAAGQGNQPTREDTDRLAAELPADRTGWDGGPLDDAGKRFYGLRESGYTGWIDQDGYPSTGPMFVRTDEPDDADEAS